MSRNVAAYNLFIIKQMSQGLAQARRIVNGPFLGYGRNSECCEILHISLVIKTLCVTGPQGACSKGTPLAPDAVRKNPWFFEVKGAAMGRMVAIFVFAFFLMGSAYGQRPFAEINTEYQYNPYADLRFSHALYCGEDTCMVLLEILYNDGLRKEDYGTLAYAFYEDYQSEVAVLQDSIDRSDSSIYENDSRDFYRIAVPNPGNAQLLVVELGKKDLAWKYRYGIDVDPSLNYGKDGLLLSTASGRPLLGSFVHQDESLRITTLDNLDTTIFVYYYSQNFNEALPPMVTESDVLNRGLSVDSIFTVATDTDFSLHRQGLYFFQVDTTSVNGIAVRSADAYYPAITKVEEIIEPLLYISTREEMEDLRSSTDKKKAFEAYWMQMAGSAGKASEMIRKYYEKVEEANYYFTTFKEGWKTDMGMIYIVYGKPDEVYNNEETVEWVYNRNLTMPIIRFSFIKIKNIFSDNHYTLFRKSNYDRHWFMSVKQWRDGKK
jgi:GWxTD domain-containing protein